MSEQESTLNEFVEDEPELPNLELGPIDIEIPTQWSSTELSDKFDVITGNSYTGEYLSEEDNGGRIFLTLKSVKKGGGFNWDSLKYYTGEVNQREIVESGELLIANTDVTQDGDIIGYSTRVPNFNSEREVAASMDLSILRPKTDDLNLPYIEYLLQTEYIHSRMRAFSAGSTVLHLNTDLVGSLSLPIPPLSEQRKIATILYTIDQAIEKAQDVIDTYETVQKGVVRELIARGVTKHGEFRSKPDENPDLYSETRWGEIPESWDIKQVSELVLDDRPVTYGVVKAGEHVQGGIPMIRGENYINGWESLSNFFRVSSDINEEYSRSTVRSGDILLAVAGANAGAVNIVPKWMPDKANISRSTARISVEKSNIAPEYMRLVLKSPFLQKQIHARKKGSAQDVLNLSDVKKFKIPLPTIDEQKRIVAIVSNMREGEIKERQIKNQYSRIKQGLMQDLLSGTIRTTDTNIQVPDEVAQHG